MNQTDKKDEQPPRRSILAALRTYFLAGLVVTAPIFITIYLISWFVGLLDDWFRPFIPIAYRPETYLPFDIPGTGVVMAVVVLTIIGGLAANFLGRSLVSISDRVIGQMPVAGTVYRALRQIFQSAVREGGASFSQVALIEYPRKGIYAVGFVTKNAAEKLNHATGETLVGIFLPTTPNPTSGFLLFLPRADIKILDMSVEEGARLVISAGLAD